MICPVDQDVTTYTDSSYAPEGGRSHSGVVVTWMGAPLSWRATRTPYVCLSTAESELTAAIEGLKMTMSLGAVSSGDYEDRSPDPPRYRQPVHDRYREAQMDLQAGGRGILGCVQLSSGSRLRTRRSLSSMSRDSTSLPTSSLNPSQDSAWRSWYLVGDGSHL